MRKKIAMKKLVREHPAEVKSPITQGQDTNQSYVIVHIEPRQSFLQAFRYQRGEGKALNHKRKRPQGTHGKKKMKVVMITAT